jgi:hypothetical protein
MTEEEAKSSQVSELVSPLPRELDAGNIISRYNQEYQRKCGESVSDLDKAINELFTATTDEYKKKAEQKRILKGRFFRAAVFALIFVVSATFLLLLIAVLKSNEGLVIALSATGVANIIASIIAIPKLIAKYLFDPQEEQKHLKLVGDILSHNQKRHEDMRK